MDQEHQHHGPAVDRRVFMAATGTTLVGATALGALRTATAAAETNGPELPRISYVTPGVGDGATMVIVGDEFTSDAEVYLYRPAKEDPDTVKQAYGHTDPAPATPPADATKAVILGEPDSHLLAAGQLSYPTVQWDPSGVPTWIWVKTPAGLSQPYLINKPELFFVEDSDVVAGQAIRVFGRDLETAREAQVNFPVALTNTETQRTYWGQYLVSNGQEQANERPYVASILFPDDIPAGPYDISMHMLYGGSHGWSNRVKIDVVENRDMISTIAREDRYYFSPSARVIRRNTRTQQVQNARGDGVSDDTKAIQVAIDAISGRGGGIVLLPAGTFAITSTIKVPPNVVLSGAGRGATSITVAPAKPVTGSFPVTKLFASPKWISGFAGDYHSSLEGQIPMIWLRSMTGVQNLRIEVGRGASIGVLLGENDPDAVVERTFVKDVDIINQHALLIKPKTLGPLFGGIIAVSGTEGVTVSGNYVLATSGLWFLAGRYPHRHTRLANNTFESYPHNNAGTISFNGVAESVVEDNEFKTGPRAFTANMGTYQNFISGNLIRYVGGLLNGSEILLSEDSGVLASGTVTAATANTVTLDTSLGLKDDQIVSTSIPHYAYILTGKGTGQYRLVAGNSDDHVLKVATDWTVIPDSTSTVQVIRATVRNIYTNNWLADLRGSLVCSGGAAMENIVAGNELHNASEISLTAVPGVAIPGAAPTSYNLIVQNRMVSSDAINLSAYFGDKNEYGKPPLYETGGMFANVVRQNQVWTRATPGADNQYYNIWFQPNYKNAPDKQGAINIRNGTFTVVEANYVYNTRNGILVDGGRKNIVRWNRMDDVDQAFFTANDPVETVYQPATF